MTKGILYGHLMSLDTAKNLQVSTSPKLDQSRPVKFPKSLFKYLKNFLFLTRLTGGKKKLHSEKELPKIGSEDCSQHHVELSIDLIMAGARPIW